MPQNVELEIGEGEHDRQIEELDRQQSASLVLLILCLLEAKHFLQQLVAERSALTLVVMTVVELVPGVLRLLLLLVGIRVLGGAIVVQTLLMVSILDGVLELDVLGVLGEQEKVL